MAATPPQLREEVAAVTALAIEEMRAQIAAAGQATSDFLADLLPGLIASFAESAAVVATEWYDEHRATLAVPGNYETFIPDLREPGIEQMLRWADAEAQTELSRLALIEGGTFRRVENGARETIISNVNNDPQGVGYQRYAREAADGCGFCQALAGRGEVYRNAFSASFGAHDNCKCVAVPAFGGAPIPVRPYTPSAKRATDADRARVRAWLARKAGKEPTGKQAQNQRRADPMRDVDASRTVVQLSATLADLERSLARFDSPATRQRIADLRAAISARTGL